MAIAGSLLVAATIVFLIWDGIRERRLGSTPRVTARAESVDATADTTFVVNVAVRNDGGGAAEAVIVEGAISGQGGAVIERAEASVALLPASSERRIGLVFRTDPRRHRLVIRPLGFERP